MIGGVVFMGSGYSATAPEKHNDEK